MTRLIVAGSGGFVPRAGLWDVLDPGGIVLRMLELTGVTRPKLLLIMTASGDSPGYLASVYSALSRVNCDVDHLSLFSQPNRPVADAVEWADAVWVGGGSTANLLALWRLHGVDVTIRAAYERGTVLGGVSAGSLCWHVGGPTDSFGSELQLVGDCLALLPHGAGVHFDAEAQRRPLLHRLVGSGELPLSYATDNGIAIVFDGEVPIEVVADVVPPRAEVGPAAYRVELVGGRVVETRLPVGPRI
ncbi:MAG: Type 1 glutamine amidotransferase-like domain-containing protein [Candidatus Nanopelagicales bacterium]